MALGAHAAGCRLGEPAAPMDDTQEFFPAPFPVYLPPSRPSSLFPCSMAPLQSPPFLPPSPLLVAAPRMQQQPRAAPLRDSPSPNSEPPSLRFSVVPAGCSTKCTASHALQQPSRSISTPLVASHRSRVCCAANSTSGCPPVFAVFAQSQHRRRSPQ
ncbi:hypothetical protein Zm00014a_005720 [Zea mays]|uniref:Uncharacterized protein n=1 Tax=Zea mays TaxID=4577 RepID=A0A317YBE3_MAIZE|nr:hypothetical protein Zm00014a_005720 [Zea mays]